MKFGFKTRKERMKSDDTMGFSMIAVFNFTAILSVRFMSISTDEDPQVQRSEVTRLRSHHSGVQSWDASSGICHSVLWQCLDI